MNTVRPINIAILAMGGEGGGVLADWLVHVGEQGGYLAQATSVPGVAQRTGATIYYLELFPRSALQKSGALPVLGLMPMPGDIDLVVASELMEAGRAVQRELVSPDRTHLVASTHRVYSMTERTALGDGRVDADALVEGCRTAALKFTGFDMAKLAEVNRSVISAVLLGAVAGSRALPFTREAYEAAVRAGGVSVKASLSAFSAGYEGAAAPAAVSGERQVGASDGLLVPPEITGQEARKLVIAGIDRTNDYQDQGYARDYVERLRPFIAHAKDGDAAGHELLAEVARQLALGMTYEDTVRVAELKIRGTRFDRVREEVGADPNQIVEIVEFMHPRVEEIADTMPIALGRWLLRNRTARTVLTRLTSRGRKVRTTSLTGFLMLYCVASLKPLRRGSLRYDREMEFLSGWLETVRRAADINIGLAVGFAQLRNLIKGYGDTYERGRSKYDTISEFLSSDIGNPIAALNLRTLIAAADRDEAGEALRAEIERLKALSRSQRRRSIFIEP